MGKTKRKWVPNFSRSERVGFRVLAVLIFTVQVFFQWGPDVFPSLNSPSYSENQREVWVQRLSDTAVLLQAPRGQFANRRSSTRYVPTSPSARPNQPQSSQQKSDLTGYDNFFKDGTDATDSVHARPPAKLSIELNTADSLTLLQVRGIGPYTAHTLLKWREKLGGFYAVDQLYDLPGIRPENIDIIASQISIDTGLVKKISINTASYEELVKHPYVSGELAGQIVRFRGYFRPFETVLELGQLDLRNPLDFDKLVPYLITHSTEDSTRSNR